MTCWKLLMIGVGQDWCVCNSGQWRTQGKAWGVLEFVFGAGGDSFYVVAVSDDDDEGYEGSYGLDREGVVGCEPEGGCEGCCCEDGAEGDDAGCGEGDGKGGEGDGHGDGGESEECACGGCDSFSAFEFEEEGEGVAEDGGECAGEGCVLPGGELGDEEDGDEAFGDVADEGERAEFFSEYAQGVGGADVF